VKTQYAKFSTTVLFYVVIAAQKFVSLDGSHDTDGTFVARLGALYAAEAANADRSG
jgi:hypothetical protein